MASKSSVKRVVARPLRSLIGRAGYQVVPKNDQRHLWQIPWDADEFARATIEETRPYTLTPPDRIMGLINAVRYVAQAGIEGDIAECGVWRGGSMMIAARTLLDEGDTSRVLHLYDTFEYMPPAEDRDIDFNGRAAKEYYPKLVGLPEYAFLPLEDVQAALEATGYPADQLRLIKGLVEDTLPEHAPEKLALLRLDTDLYRSTKHELECLFPRIVEGGVLIIDDYGHFWGARDAVDEYFAERGIRILLNRMDYSGRLAIVGSGRMGL
jgi:O-methyltransferase